MIYIPVLSYRVTGFVRRHHFMKTMREARVVAVQRLLLSVSAAD